MPTLDSISILICTYNRAPLLEQTLSALDASSISGRCAIDVVIVDNNSSDHTRAIVERAAARGRWPVQYVHEPRQGKGYALNRGLSVARGEVIALTDDDVLPAPDWLDRIVRQFGAEDIVFLFGKVLPRWEILPPPELLTTQARDIWGPLALVDYGDEPDRYDAASFHTKRLPIGANLAVRRDAIDRIGGWRNDLGKVDNTLIAGEDRELCVRLYRAGLYSGLYDPEMVVRHLVPASRLKREYFRRWFYWHGRTLARMSAAVYVDLDLARVPYVGGVPRFVYREFLGQIVRWLRRAGRHDAFALLAEELKLVEYLGFFAESWARHKPRLRRGLPPRPDVLLTRSMD
jgi:glycosyltransferase involved in cell wall biosynthesis